MHFLLNLQDTTTVKVPLKFEIADVINKDGAAYIDVNYTRGTEFVELKFATIDESQPAPANAEGFTGTCVVKGTIYVVYQLDGIAIAPAVIEEPVADLVEEVVEEIVEEVIEEITEEIIEDDTPTKGLVHDEVFVDESEFDLEDDVDDTTEDDTYDDTDRE